MAQNLIPRESAGVYRETGSEVKFRTKRIYFIFIYFFARLCT